MSRAPIFYFVTTFLLCFVVLALVIPNNTVKKLVIDNMPNSDTNSDLDEERYNAYRYNAYRNLAPNEDLNEGQSEEIDKSQKTDQINEVNSETPHIVSTTPGWNEKYMKIVIDKIDDIKSTLVAKNSVEKTMRRFRKNEVDVVRTFLKLNSSSITEDKAMLETYKYLSFPLQGVCRTLKRIGGHWMERKATKEVDGDKFVCLDNIMDNKQNKCLIYSFGVSRDWTFEDYMDIAGCHIYAYDHTVDFPSTRGTNIKFFKKGLGTGKKMATLDKHLKKNGHENATVEYLKIDIEGWELTGLPDWLSSGALDNVNQVAMELHMNRLHNPRPKFKGLLEALQELNRKNFRLISHEVNMLMGPGKGGFYNFMEVVFMKDTKWNYLD